MSKPIELRALFAEKTHEELVDICCQLFFDNMSDERLTKIEELEKALDKACGEIEHLADDAYGCQWSAKQWKEWCLHDDD